MQKRHNWSWEDIDGRQIEKTLQITIYQNPLSNGASGSQMTQFDKKIEMFRYKP